MSRRLSPREVARALQRLRDDDRGDIGVESAVVTVTEEHLEATVDGTTKVFDRPTGWPDPPDDPELRTSNPAVTATYTDDPAGGEATDRTETEP